MGSTRRIALPTLGAVALTLFATASGRAEIVLRDVTQASGIDYRNVCGASRAEDKGWIVEYMGAGAAWLDYNGDSHLDLYLVNGSQLDRPQGKGEPNRMYRGDGRPPCGTNLEKSPLPPLAPPLSPKSSSWAFTVRQGWASKRVRADKTRGAANRFRT